MNSMLFWYIRNYIRNNYKTIIVIVLFVYLVRIFFISSNLHDNGKNVIEPNFEIIKNQVHLKNVNELIKDEHDKIEQKQHKLIKDYGGELNDLFLDAKQNEIFRIFKPALISEHRHKIVLHGDRELKSTEEMYTILEYTKIGMKRYNKKYNLNVIDRCLLIFFTVCDQPKTVIIHESIIICQ